MRITRFAVAAAALPLRGLASFGRRVVSGADAVLDLEIEDAPELRDRDLLLRRIRRAASDDRVAALLVRLREPPAGWASCEDLRAALLAVRAAGKPVYAWLEAPGNALVFVASACDRVLAVPSGELGLVGIGVELTFFGAALGRLGVRPDFEAAGEYKSFGEPFTRSFPSRENQEAVRALVEDWNRQLVEGIASGRELPAERVREILSNAPLSAQDARDAGLVDELMYEDQLEDWLKAQIGPKAHLVPYARWAFFDGATERLGAAGQGGDVVAVVHLQGPIVMEDRTAGASIGARKVVPLLAKLREDDKVAAVVLHVDSPGGSALASDLIWREVDELRRKKPVVASFEDVAASGGVYLSAPAHAIYARAGSLTGSIGVFGGKLVVGEGMRRIGVHTQEVLGAPNANLFSATKGFSDGQRTRFRASLQRFYDGFVERVAEGRGRPVDEVEPHCRGRVWTGRAALERRLVDAEGGLDAAIDRARSLAGVGRWRRRDLIGHEPPLVGRVVQAVLRQVAPTGARALVDRLAGGALAEIALAHPGQPLAILPFSARWT